MKSGDGNKCEASSQKSDQLAKSLKHSETLRLFMAKPVATKFRSLKEELLNTYGLFNTSL